MISTYLPRRILVVGGTGHTGERLCRRLARSGVEVRVLTRSPDSHIARKLSDDGCKVMEGDTLRRWMLWEAMEGCEAMVSCAHIRFAEPLVQACYRCGVERFVTMSSTRRFSRIESDSVNTVLAGEAYVMDSSLEWTVIRPTMIFGGERDRNLTRLVNWVRRHRWVPVVGTGAALTQPVFVEDVVTAMMECLRRSVCVHRAYTIAGEEPITWRQMIEEVAQALRFAVRIVPVPQSMAVTGVRMLGPLARRGAITPDAIQRAQEDKTFSIQEAIEDLRFDPTPFREALEMKIRGEAEVEALYPPFAPGQEPPGPPGNDDEDVTESTGEWMRRQTGG